MLIAVIADTHDRIPAGLPERLKEADEIWHLGDVCDPGTIVEIEQLGIPMRVLLGNCDSNMVWPLELTLEREGVLFYLTHIPPLRAPHGVQAVLHAHTHVPRDEVRHGVRWLNPGCVSWPRGMPPSFAWLEVSGGKLTQWKLMRV